jgi:hypothetical protein
MPPYFCRISGRESTQARENLTHGRRIKFFVAQISKSAVSPISNRLGAEFSTTPVWPKVCVLEIRDTAGCNPALRPKNFVLRPSRILREI